MSDHEGNAKNNVKECFLYIFHNVIWSLSIHIQTLMNTWTEHSLRKMGLVTQHNIEKNTRLLYSSEKFESQTSLWVYQHQKSYFRLFYYAKILLRLGIRRNVYRKIKFIFATLEYFVVLHYDYINNRFLTKI